MKRALIFVHRWLGVALCVLFLLWFPSGIGMMYWGYPTVTQMDRLERSPALSPASVVVSPDEAWKALGYDGSPGRVRLNIYDGRPAYRFPSFGDPGDVVFADTGEPLRGVTRETTDRIASAWTGQRIEDAAVRAVDEVDQWTLQTSLANLSPVWKYTWPTGDEVYVSEVTGEVVQYTTRASRIGAYLGPIPHWFYFTPLRKHGPEWSRLVIWSSGIGTLAAIFGLAIGVWMYSPRKVYRHDGAPARLPYYGQKRLHTILGLVFGIATATWAFSGMLSMDPFPSRTGGASGARSDYGDEIREALRGDAPLTAFAARHPRAALEALDGLAVKELELTAVLGEPVYLATLAGGDTRLVPLAGAPREGAAQADVIRAIETAVGAEHLREIRVLDQYDAYYLDRRRERPLPVILARTDNAVESRYYVDPRTARVVGSYDTDAWVNRWVYHGLHSLDFPWLYNYRPLWDIVVITFMTGGTTLCVTSLVLAWRVLGRTLRRPRLRAAGALGIDA